MAGRDDERKLLNRFIFRLVSFWFTTLISFSTVRRVSFADWQVRAKPPETHLKANDMQSPLATQTLWMSAWCVFFISGFARAETGAGEAAIWTRHTLDAGDVEAGKVGADGVRLADVNGDGLPDVATGWENGDAIRVCLNPGPEKSREPWPGVTVGRVKGAEDAVLVDLDGDGRLDVVSCTEGNTRTVFVHWAPASAADYLNPEKWVTATVPGLEKKQLWMYALPFDVDKDGDADLVLGSKGEGATVGWLENLGTGRDLSGWPYHVLYKAGWIMSILAHDLDRDGRTDLVFSDRKGSSTGVYWLQANPDSAAAPFAAPVCLGLQDREVMFVDVVDWNADGRDDIAAAVKEREINLLVQPKDIQSLWVEVKLNAPGGQFPDRFGTSKAVKIVPLAPGKPPGYFVTCEKADGDLSGVFWVDFGTGGESSSFHDISGPEGVKYDRIEMVDLDGDGDLDLMTCAERPNMGVFWYENPTIP